MFCSSLDALGQHGARTGDHSNADPTARKIPGPPVALLDPFDNFRQATISIGVVAPNAGKVVFATKGSGVLISSDDNQRGVHPDCKAYVFDPQDGWLPTQVSVRLPASVGTQKNDNGVLLQLVDGQQRIWASPPDDADLAVIVAPDLSKYRSVHAIPFKALSTSDEIYQGASIFVLGYPALLGEDFLTTPYARGGIISWTDVNDPENKPFLVDANLYPGNSGGPVFHTRTGVTKGGGFVLGGGISLIGIVSKGAVERAPVVAGGVPIQTRDAAGQINPAQAMVLGIGGIGIIEPVSRAMTILARCLKQ